MFAAITHLYNSTTLACQILQSVQMSDPERTTDTPVSIIRLSAVVIDEDSVVAAVRENGTAERSKCIMFIPFRVIRCY